MITKMSCSFFSSQLLLLVLPLLLVFSATLPFGASQLPQDEVDALMDIAKTLGNKTKWNFNADPCSGADGWDNGSEDAVACNCTLVPNSSVCHVTSIVLKSQNLPGKLPPELIRLPYLQGIDLTRNYLNGTLPPEWGALPLLHISLVGNRLTGSLPVELANITTLKNLTIDYNNFSGVLPVELGNLPNIERMLLTSNNFTGELPATFARLTTLKDFRISDNSFSGKIPNFIQNWTNLTRLEIQASGLTGPIPSGISLLTKLTDIRITDLNGTESSFPPLKNLTKLKTLMLRNCNISGQLPEYLGEMTTLNSLDLSFNKLTGEIPRSFSGLAKADYIFLTGNMLNGSVPDWLEGGYIDLSYNNFTPSPNSGAVGCEQRGGLNLFASSSGGNASSVSCLKIAKCLKTLYSLHINCGGNEVIQSENFTRVTTATYEADPDTSSPSSFRRSSTNWASSNTGYFPDDNGPDTLIWTNTSRLSTNNPQLYLDARLSPISLTYYGFCLGNGMYTVNLHFAEIMFQNDKTYRSLGRRIFDIYIQGSLQLKDFNIASEAGGFGIPVVKNFTVNVTSNSLEIRLYWAGKGTTGIPARGVYGPLISAISVVPNFKPPRDRVSMNRNFYLGLGAGVGSLLLLIGIWLVYKVVKKRNKIQRKKLYFKRNGGLLLEQQLSSGEVNVEKIKLFTSKELEKSTDNYNNDRIIGQGAQGVVYKGMLADGRIVAVKKSKIVDEGKLTEFINEVVILSQINHRNVVQLLGCCLETDVPVLVYEFVPNGTLSRSISEQNEEFPLTWKMRLRIATEIAGALSYLHSAAAFPIYHRDIKSTNILLDEKFRAKVADFGISRSIAIDQTHLTTAVHGTFGYLDPEYFQSSQFTDKSDVYSFGVVLVELLTGQKPICAITRRAQEEEYYRSLATKFIVSMQEDILYEILDARVRKEAKGKEIRVVSNLALRCLDLNGRNRPTMREVTMELEAIQMLPENNAPNAQYDVGVEYLENDSLRLWDVVSSSDDQSASYDCPSSSLLEHQQSATKTWVTYWMVIMLLLSNFLQNRNREIVNS